MNIANKTSISRQIYAKKQVNQKKNIKRISFNHDKKLKVIRSFNKFIIFCMLLFISLLIFSYYLVTKKESQVILLHNQTNEMNFENLRLQNALDKTKSFYNINKKASNFNFLKKADKILEIKSTTNLKKFNKTPLKRNVKPIPGY